jgi:hypothetical protein
MFWLEVVGIRNQGSGLANSAPGPNKKLQTTRSATGIQGIHYIAQLYEEFVV